MFAKSGTAAAAAYAASVTANKVTPWVAAGKEFLTPFVWISFRNAVVSLRFDRADKASTKIAVHCAYTLHVAKL